MPKISVIIPTYNRAGTLPRAIDSILDQTIKDIELIVVDDGSTDSTPEILGDYISEDKRIKILKQKNQGPATARNNGVVRSSSKYIAFMDSDDACAVNRLEMQLNFLLQYPKYSACALSNLSPITDYYPRVISDTYGRHQTYNGSPFQSKKQYYVIGPHSLMEKDSYIKIAGQRSQGVIIEDLDFTLRYSHYYTWASIQDRGSYFYTYPYDNSKVGQVNNNILDYAKRMSACYISEWCRINNIEDPVEQGKSLSGIIAITAKISLKDRAIIYNNIRYFRRTLLLIGGMSKKESKKYLVSILSDNPLDRWLINFWFKLFL